MQTEPSSDMRGLPLAGGTAAADATDAAAAALAAFLRHHGRVAVLSGAGLSTGSGIPDYRDDDGRWKHRQPVQFGDFVSRAAVRRRYWAQSYAGWHRIEAAIPNAAHEAIADLESDGRVTGVITQNVDDLHRRAGSRNVIDLHGRLHAVRCLQCGGTTSRQAFQSQLEDRNPDWRARVTLIGPDGDSTLAAADFERFVVPDCADCAGMLKPDVVFFGEAVPGERVSRAADLVGRSAALLVVGSSLMVFSGFRFARRAFETGRAIGIVNRGVTRADAIASARFTGDCAVLLPAALAALGA